MIQLPSIQLTMQLAYSEIQTNQSFYLIVVEHFLVELKCFAMPNLYGFLNFQEGLARLEKRKKWESKERQLALDNLEKFQEEARTARRRMWQYGDIQSDDEDTAPPARKAGGKR